MKRRLFTLLFLLLLPSLVFGLASAQGAGVQSLPGGGWVTGTQVQNVEPRLPRCCTRRFGELSGHQFRVAGWVHGLSHCRVQ
jgi:hypothetical protein